MPSRNSCYPSTGHQDAGEAVVPATESLLADEPVRTSPSSGRSTVRRISPSAPRDLARGVRETRRCLSLTPARWWRCNAKDLHHEACAALFRRFQSPIIVPAPIVTEVAHFLQIEPGPAVEAAFLDALARS
jgi:hypothetical protein